MLTEKQANAVEELEYALFLMGQANVVLVLTTRGVFAVDNHKLSQRTTRDPDDLALIGRKLEGASIFAKPPESRRCGYCELNFYPVGEEVDCPSCRSQSYWRD